MQPVMLQASLVVENLVAVFRADSEVLMMRLLLKFLEEVVVQVVAAVLTVIPTVSLDLHSLEASVVLQVSLRANLHLFLVLEVLADRPVNLRAMLHHLPARLVLVAVAILKASLLLIRLVDQVAPVRPASPVQHPVATQ
jgi:hypothetical protein